MTQLRAAALALLMLKLVTPSRIARAETPPIEAKATFSAAEVVLGERLRLRVTIVHPRDVVVSVQPSERTNALQVVEVLRPTETSAGATTLTQAEYVLAAFNLGRIDAAPLRLAWLRSDGESGELNLVPPPFIVRETVPAQDTVYRPVKPQLGIAGGPPAWQGRAIVGGAIAGVLLLALGVAFTLRTRVRRPVLVPVGSSVDAIEVAARAQLDALGADAPLTRGDYDTYYGTIALIVRDYLQQRFQFGARALTTPELQRRMVQLGVERWQARLVAGLLDRCDAAVYAGRRPDPASADHDLTVAFEIIELSRPTSEAETTAPAVVGVAG